MSAIKKHIYPTEVKHFMPLNLKKILQQYGITQSKLALATCQDRGSGAGLPLSQPAISRLVHTSEWPTFTDKESLTNQIIQFLCLNGVPEHELEGAFDVDLDAEGVDVKRRVRIRPQVLKFPEIKQARLLVQTKPKKPLFMPVEPEMLTKEAKKLFKLMNSPFINDVRNSGDLFVDSSQRYVAENMWQTSKHGGFLAVIGESGSGKTTLRKALVDRIQKENARITVIHPRTIDKAKLSTGGICDAVIRDLSMNKPKMALEAKARQIEELLIGSGRAGNSHVLIIEEAHDLPIPTLKYLKRFYEIEDGFKKLLSIILLGQPELKAKLNERLNFEAREVIRRIEVAEIAPLNSNLEAYLELKFSRMNRKLTDVFETDAFDAIRGRLSLAGRGDISMLYPLMVNNVVTKAMNVAAEIGAAKIDADIIKDV